MTIIEAINEVNNLKPNDYGNEDKIKWLYRLDQQIKQEICDTHRYNEGETEPTLENYDSQHTNTVLLVPAPYDELYIHFLAAQIDYYNREYDGFNATNAMYTAVLGSFRNRYNATHRPLFDRKKYY